MSTKILGMKSRVIMQFNLIGYKELTQTAWGEGVNTIMIKCVMFLQKGLIAEKIVV